MEKKKWSWVRIFFIPLTPLRFVVAAEQQDAWKPCFRILKKRSEDKLKRYLMVGGFHYYMAMRLSFWEMA